MGLDVRKETSEYQNQNICKGQKNLFMFIPLAVLHVIYHFFHTQLYAERVNNIMIQMF